MKKKFLFVVIVFGILGFMGCTKANATDFFRQLEEPKTAVEGDWWIRNVGDGEDTYEYTNNQWNPLFGNSERRKVAQAKYKREVYDVNVQLQKEDIDKAEKNPDEFKDIPENETELITMIDSPTPITVRVPKREIDTEKIYSSFYIDDSVPMFLEPLSNAVNNSTSDSNSEPASTSDSAIDASNPNNEELEGSTENTNTIPEGTEKENADSNPSDSTSTSEKSTDISEAENSSESTEKETHTNSPSEFSARDGFFPVKIGNTITRNELLDLISYSGNKNHLTIEIKTTNYVYVTKDAKVYHHDLNALLGKAKLENLKVVLEERAKQLGLTLSKENSDKTIETINTSLPGLYKVFFSDGIKTVSSTVTVGDLANIDNYNKSSAGNEDVKVSNEQSSNHSKLTMSEQKSLPQTNDSNNISFILLGTILLISVGVFYKKYI